MSRLQQRLRKRTPVIMYDYLDGPNHTHRDGDSTPCPRCQSWVVSDETIMVEQAKHEDGCPKKTAFLLACQCQREAPGW